MHHTRIEVPDELSVENYFRIWIMAEVAQLLVIS